MKLSDVSVCFVEAEDGGLVLSNPVGDSIDAVEFLGATGFNAVCARRCLTVKALLDKMSTVPAAMLSCWL